MPIMRTVQIVIEEDIDTGKAAVLVQTGTDNPVDTGIRAATAADAVKMLADKLGGRS